MILLGTAGTGKSFVIKALKEYLNNSLLIAAPTGKAAYNIGGSTIHSLLSLPRELYKESKLPSASKNKLQEKFKNIEYLIIDEFSMIGLRMLYWIDLRLKDATGMKDKIFGGINIILVGDIFQLPPVNDTSLCRNFGDKKIAQQTMHATMLYKEFRNVVILQQNVRQQGTDIDQINFRRCLENVRLGTFDDIDYQLLETRMWHNEDISSQFKSIVDDSIHVYFRKINVNEQNWNRVTKLRKQILKIPSYNPHHLAGRASSSEAGGLQKNLYLCKGARVMLIKNLWPEHGLCNGAMGTVVSMIFRQGESVRNMHFNEDDEDFAPLW